MGRLKKDGTPVLLGPVVAEKLVASLEASKSRPLSRLLFGFGIRHVGATVGEALAAAFGSIAAIEEAARTVPPKPGDGLSIAAALAADPLASVEGIGPKIAASIRAFFDNPENVAVLSRLRSRPASCSQTSAGSRFARRRSQRPDVRAYRRAVTLHP